MNIALVCHKADTGNHYKNYLAQLLICNNSSNFSTIYLSQYVRKQKSLSGNFIILIETEANSGIALRYFIDIQLPNIIRKIKADIILNLSGLVSKRIKIPQILLLAAADHFETGIGTRAFWQKFYQKTVLNNIRYAAAVIIYSQKALLIAEERNGGPIGNSNIILYTASDHFQPLEWPQKILTKGSYTNNREFFIAVLNNEEAQYTNLLKAFSVFKKWQQSSMQLVMLAAKDFDEEKFNEKLATYKYRNDVQLFKDLPEKQISALMASAYCMVYNNKDENLLPLVQSIKSAIPVIAFKSSGAEEYGLDAVLYCETNTFESMGKKMIHLYNNEPLKETLSAKCREVALLFIQEHESQKLWNIIDSVVKK